MVSKKARQDRILQIVGKNIVPSQEKLSSLLMEERIDVTQATLSRDVQDLGLVKVRGRYQTAGATDVVPQTANIRLAFEQFVVRTGASGNIVAIKTTPGNAHSVAVVIDAAQWPEVLGTIAGDDTIFVLLRGARMSGKVLKRIQELST
jgi:transcriptional regulator of arginine metabolism